MQMIDVNMAINAIENERMQKESKPNTDMVPEIVGILSIKKANDVMKEAAQRPNPKELWMTLWYESEVCVLFSDSNLGKSIYAVQIASEIAKIQRTLYFDFELSDKQYQLRYTDDQGNLFKFPDNLYRVDIDRDSLDVSNFEDAVINSIESSALETGANVLIIDNLTFLCLASEKGDAAGNLMMRLTALKKRHGWSILIIAHTPKRPLTNPITANDLAGSKKLYNFFDSGFAIGKSAKDSGLRYIKQLKVRHGEYTYDSDNVIVAEIKKDGSFLHFNHVGFSTEREHLKEQSESDKSAIIDKAKELSTEGKSTREIAKELGISAMSVSRYLRQV